MGFGSTVAMGCLVTAAIVLGPQHVKVETYEQAAQMFVPVYGRWAVTLFAVVARHRLLRSCCRDRAQRGLRARSGFRLDMGHRQEAA